jgi:hypothetical protein
MKNITQLILDKLDKPYDYIAKAKHGKSPEILLGDFIECVICNDVTSRNANIYLGISEQTFNRLVKRVFPSTKLQGGGETWSFYMLSLVAHKKCHKCLVIKPIIEIAASNSVCRDCRTAYNTSDNRRIKNRKQQKDFYYNNPHYYNEKAARYRAQKIKACPTWVSLQDLQDIYDNKPEGHHVDHIVPLQGKYVCGLHVPWNLQYLSVSDNCSKGNYHESEEYWK